MGKKKLSLKPVQRGFATTSVASKKPPKEEVVAEVDSEVSVATSAAVSTGPTTGAATPSPEANGQSNGEATGPKADWEDEKKLEEIALQSLVDRLHEKGEREVSRALKAIEYDKRLASINPHLEVNEAIRDQVLELALQEEVDKGVFTKPLMRGEDDKSLLRIFVAYHVLQKLGFSEARISQCLLEGIGESDTWEEALEWMWLHLSEDECLQRGEYAKKEEESLPSTIEPPLGSDLVDDQSLLADPVNINTSPSSPAKSSNRSSKAPITSNNGPLFQSINEAESSPSETSASDDEDPNLQKANEDWAKLMFELDNLKIAAAGGTESKSKGGGKKGKGNGVVLETPDMVKLKRKITRVEKEYMFSRKEADVYLKNLKAQRDAEALEARLKGKQTEAAKANEESSKENIGDNEVKEADGSVISNSDDEEGGLFGNMLDEPPPPTEEQESTSTTTIVRSLPIPKQFSFSGNLPKTLLISILSKHRVPPIPIFVKLSGGSRAARAGLEIRWTPTQRKIWKMEEFACEDMVQAENYVSTLALHELQAEGDISAVNWRTIPPAYREVWEELDQKRRQMADAEKREVWGKIQGIVEKKLAVGSTTSSVINSKGSSQVAMPILPTSRIIQDTVDEKLVADFERRRHSPAYQNMLIARNNLPIASFRQEIIDTLDQSQIIVLSGETGCGKSTQLPSFILEDQLSKGKSCKIYVTEPRRISAISLAQRVSQELGDAPGVMGTNNSLVGYSIRLEAKVSASTRLAFVTNGIALRMLESGSSGGNSKGTAFDEITHIIVDEVHERSIESDFLLIVLKSLVEQRKDLKVVLMSATLDAEKISDFFGGCPTLSVPGRTFPVNVNYLEDAIQLCDWHIDETSTYALRGRGKFANNGGGIIKKQLEWSEENAPNEEDDDDENDADENGNGSGTITPNPAKLASSKYSLRTVETINLLDNRQIPYDLIIRLLERICFEDENLGRYSAATLVFMPGLGEIRKLNDALAGHPAFGGGDFVIYPLHSTISSEGQSQVFDIPPSGVRKIVISTNIAETGVTIPDITCVIDSGKHREMRYDEKRQISRLVETFIARSNAKQRRGRAGRVQEGLAFHLFTKARHDTQLMEHPVPEMLRLSLQDLALRIKILKIKLGNSIEEVLLKALDPPSSTNISRAISALVEVKALTTNEEITPMGRLLSKLPMDVHLGKFLLVAAMTKCLDPALTIAATLNSKSPFITPFGYESQADAAKKSFAFGNSDFFTLANVFASWRRASDNPNFVRIFCRKHYISHQNLQQIEELRQQLLSYLIDSSFVQVTSAQKHEISQARYGKGFRTRFVTVPPELSINGENLHVLGAALAAGLYPKLLSFDPSGGLKTILNQQPVAAHPSSINFRVRQIEFGTNYLAYFTIMQSKRLYAWETGPVDDRALALLCGDQADFRLSANSLFIDRKIRYHINPKTAIAFKVLREQFANAMTTRLRGKSLTSDQEKWFDLGIKCLTIGLYDDPTGGGPGVGVV